MASQSRCYGSLLTEALKGTPHKGEASKSNAPLKDESYNKPKNETELQSNSQNGHQDPTNQRESSREASNNAPAPERSHERLIPGPKNEVTKPKDIVNHHIARQQIESLWAIQNEVDIDTDEEVMNWLERELEKQNYEKNFRYSNMLYASMPLPVELDMVATEAANSHPQLTVPDAGEIALIVQRGFPAFAPPRQPVVLVERSLGYPPLSNAAYDLTTHGIDANLRRRLSNKRKEERDGAYVAEPVTRPRTPLGPCIVNGSTPVVPSSVPTAGDAKTREFCNKCQKRHIEQGAPLSLENRDTCRSMLPGWFPKERFEKPWEAFIGMNNKYVRLCQIIQGIEHNEEAESDWQKEYHDSTPEWRAVGRHGGWWKCRIGSEEDNPGVPAVERNCKACLKRRAIIAKQPMRVTEDIAEQKKSIEDWIEKYMKKEMVKDRAYVLARVKTEGH